MRGVGSGRGELLDRFYRNKNPRGLPEDPYFIYSKIMEYVIDQNYFRAPELRNYLSDSRQNIAILTDTAIFEMLKGSDPVLTASESLTILSDFPDQVCCTSGSGNLMRSELQQHKAIITPLDTNYTKTVRAFLHAIADYLRKGRVGEFPIAQAKLRNEIDTAIKQRSDHSHNKKAIVNPLQVLRTNVTPELQKKIRKGELSDDVYKFVYQAGFISFQYAIKNSSISNNIAEQMYLNYCFLSRYIIVYILSSLRWFELGGAEGLAPEKATNDMLDIDYLVMSSYFDGIFSRETENNVRYQKMFDFFKMKPKP
jgi:hypothetical protein